MFWCILTRNESTTWYLHMSAKPCTLSHCAIVHNTNSLSGWGKKASERGAQRDLIHFKWNFVAERKCANDYLRASMSACVSGRSSTFNHWCELDTKLHRAHIYTYILSIYLLFSSLFIGLFLTWVHIQLFYRYIGERCSVVRSATAGFFDIVGDTLVHVFLFTLTPPAVETRWRTIVFRSKSNHVYERVFVYAGGSYVKYESATYGHLLRGLYCFE